MQFYEDSGISVSAFLEKHSLALKCKKCLSEGKDRWRHPPTKSKIMGAASNQRHKHCKHSRIGDSFKKSPCQIMENELHKVIAEHRAKGRKVSQNFTRVTTRTLIKTALPDKAESFKASIGWFMRFLKRKKIKFRKRKSGKKYDGKLNLDKILKAR